MIKVRFIHTADLHLDTPFKGLSSLNRDLAGQLKDATFESFHRIIDLCIDKKVDFLVIAGDTFDSEEQSLAAILRFYHEIERLSSKGIPAYIICGNHDPLSAWPDDPLPSGIYRFGSQEVEKVTFSKKGKPLCDIYGISYPQKEVRDNLAIRYHPIGEPAPFNIALLHATVGSPGPHESYAPFRMEDVLSNPFDYWALGHIHKRHTIREEKPVVIYPGNPQGRDFGETGEKGCLLVEMEKGNNPDILFIPTQTVRFEELEVSLEGTDNILEAYKLIQQAIEKKTEARNTGFILRLTLTGHTPLHGKLLNTEETDQLTEQLNQIWADRSPMVRIDRIIPQTLPFFDIESLKESNDFTAEMLQLAEQYRTIPEKLKDLTDRTEKGFNHVRTRHLLDPLTREELQELVEKAQWLLLDQLKKEK